MTDRAKRFLKQLLFVLAAGGLGSLFTLRAGEFPLDHALPPLYPPPWLFSAIWTILYITLAYAASTLDPAEAKRPMLIYYIGLALSFLLPVLHYRAHAHVPAAVTAVLLLGIAVLLIREIKPLNRRASALMWPFALWMAYMAYLMIGVAALNRA